MQEWMLNLRPDQLPMPHRQLAETIGVEATIKLMQAYGGTNYYIPKADLLLRQIRDKAIRAEYTGYNTKELAIKYDLSQQQIYNILRDEGIIDGQMTLFTINDD